MQFDSDVAIDATATENAIEKEVKLSSSVVIKPFDSRCRYWAKIIRAGKDIPQPSQVDSANDIPSKYLQRGEDELLPGDALLEGEENHRRKLRGWSYWINYCMPDGSLLCFKSGEFGELKKKMKAAGMNPELLKGSGDVAAMIRILHALRAGIDLE